MITKQKYVNTWLARRSTRTNLAEHWHEPMQRFPEKGATHSFLQDHDSADGILSVRQTRFTVNRMVKLQYSGAAGGLVRGIAVVNLHTSGEDGEYYPVDFRIYAKEADGKTKNDHFQEMLLRAVGDKQIQAKTVLFDSWYGSWRLKLIHRLGLTFYTTRKANRMVSLSADDGYIQLDALDWIKHGIIVKLKKLPFKVKLFKGVAATLTGITNDPDETVITQVALALRRISPRIKTDRLGQMPVSKSSFIISLAATMPGFHSRLTLPCSTKPSIAFILTCSATICETNFAALLGFPADLAKVLSISLSRQKAGHAVARARSFAQSWGHFQLRVG